MGSFGLPELLILSIIFTPFIICAVVSGVLFERQRRSKVAGFALGCLLGPIGLLIAFLTPPSE